MNNRELADLAYDYQMLYGCNVNLQRALPDVRDSLKPVHRKILYTIYKRWKGDKFSTKVAKGATGEIHAHGDQGMADIFTAMAQPFSNNVCYLESSGNIGNAESGKDAAADRYTSMWMTKFALEVFFQEFDGKVNMIPSYDGSTVEPSVLPAKFPLILLNGTSGIGYTLSTDVPPYNLNEVADATIKLLKNPQANIHLVPDSPTGCDIIAIDPTTFSMQSTFEIDNRNFVITFKNTPYKKFIDDIDKSLRVLQDSPQKIQEILTADINKVKDSPSGYEYEIHCKECNLYNVINILFKKISGFRITLSTKNMVVIDNFQTKHYDARQILCAWIVNRLQDKRGFYLRKLITVQTELNMLEGKEFMLRPENIDNTIKIFRKCNERQEIIPALVEGYPGKITTSQANYVHELHLYRLTAGEYQKTLEKIEEIKKEIEEVREIVETPEKIRDIIIGELESIKKKYGEPRRSKILNKKTEGQMNIEVVQLLTDGSILFGETENPEHLSSDITPISSEKIILVDEKGNFLWVEPSKLEHNKPLTLMSISHVPMSKCIFASSGVENNILILSNKGRVKYLPLDRIPTNSTRRPIIPLDEDEIIVSILEVRDNNQDDILIYTADGLGKRIMTSDISKQLSIDATGTFIIKNCDNVGGMFMLDPNKPLLVYVTKLGRLRVNQSKFLSASRKFGQSSHIIKLSSQDDLIAIFCTKPGRSIQLTHADSQISTVTIDSLDISTMGQEPRRPNHVPGVRVIRATLI